MKPAPMKPASTQSARRAFAPAALGWLAWPVLASLAAESAGADPGSAPGVHIHVSPDGDDTAEGSETAPFRTVFRAQRAARAAVPTAAGDVIVHLAAGVHRLERTLEFDESDSGGAGRTVVYRGSGDPGAARLLGSVLLRGWETHRDGVWKIRLPGGTRFDTLYENGKRAWKARFPNHEADPDFPTARGRYLVTEDGTPKRHDRDGEAAPKGPGWLIYPAGDAPPALSGGKAALLLYPGGKCDWHRGVHRIRSLDPASRKLVFEASSLPFGVGAEARFFLEDDPGLLDAPGEFFLDEENDTLFYRPMGEGHPDELGIAAPAVARLIQFKGASRDRCVSNLRLEGLALEETDGSPLGWWSTRFGLEDGALVWMRNASGVEIRDCHLKNGGRHGVMMAGHNTGNRVSGCRIGHMGVNGVTLSNRWHDPKEAPPVLDRCEGNLVRDCRVHHVGEIHTYAACVNLFNVRDNEIAHCELHDSVRYGVTLRGNTGPQYGPPVSLASQPECAGNRLHHLRIHRCGQDGGDMGAIHCANLNNPGGGCVNVFEQITVADTRAVPSVKDIAPDGIFLDWPKMAMDQVFRHVQVVRSQGTQIRSHRSENADSARTVNVSWKEGFDPGAMDYENIGLTASFPAAFGGRPSPPAAPPAPAGLSAGAVAHDTVELRWRRPDHAFREGATYIVYRDGKAVARTAELRFLDRALAENAPYRYAVAAQDGDLSHPGPQSGVCAARTPPDRIPPRAVAAWSSRDGGRIRVLFSKAMAPGALGEAANYRLRPPAAIGKAIPVAPACVELAIADPRRDSRYRLAMESLTDDTPSRNPLEGGGDVEVVPGGAGISYPMRLTRDGRLLDCLGSGGDARLLGGAIVDPEGGPFGGPALLLNGIDACAEAPGGFDLGSGDFTLMLWMRKEGGGHTALSKGNGFDKDGGWSFGWPGSEAPASVSLRAGNVFYHTAAQSVPAGEWTHVAFVRSGNRGSTFVNGEASGGPHDLSAMPELGSDHPLRIGRRPHEPDPAWFRGRIAEVAILFRALSQTELRERCGAGGSDPGPPLPADGPRAGAILPPAGAASCGIAPVSILRLIRARSPVGSEPVKSSVALLEISAPGWK